MFANEQSVMGCPAQAMKGFPIPVAKWLHTWTTLSTETGRFFFE